ncbi:MAG: CoA-binding protein [Kaiparowitsia implicata GSE-PSE-MK54-09C]|jgi:succinyl-CoA synthetase alpha subunit|nr:CoA-binding protein [Kaiparowitsia implicata GSE-PSE-MK54-09C]
MVFSADSKVLVQGITNSLGRVYTPLMLTYGTSILAGVDPGAGGDTVAGVPVFDLVSQALDAVGDVDVSIIVTAPYAALDAALEAIAAGIRQIVMVTDSVPPLDMVRLLRKANATDTLVIGPNSPGVIVPGQVLLGTHPAEFYAPGNVGLISRSGSLTYEVALQLTKAGIGQSIAVGIGGDRIVGSSFQQWLQILDEDDRTDAIVLVGEIGGDSEEVAARYIAEAIDKPVIAYLAGRTAPKGQQMGHAGAIIASQFGDGGKELGTVESKLAAFEAAGVPVGDRPSAIPHLVRQVLQSQNCQKKSTN